MVAALLHEDATSIPWRSMTDLCHLTDFSLGALRICIGLVVEARAKAELQMHATLSEDEHVTARRRKHAQTTTVDSLDPYKIQQSNESPQYDDQAFGRNANGGGGTFDIESLPMFDDKGLLLLDLGPINSKISTGGA